MSLIKTAPIRLAVAVFLLGTASLAWIFGLGNGLPKDKPRELPATPPAGFALVELFTSEGCSSCPAAEELLSVIHNEKKERVWLLAFHVDYWDRLGWKDPFSSGDFSRRQSEYARIFRLNSVYTPQAVVNGTNEFVGSDENKLRNAIIHGLNDAENRTPGLSLHLTLSPTKTVDGKISVQYHITNAGSAKLNIALVQLKATTRVLAGENKDRTLGHINIVRDFKTVDPDKHATGAVTLKIPSGLTEKDFAVIGFLQNPESGAVLSVTEAIK